MRTTVGPLIILPGLVLALLVMVVERLALTRLPTTVTAEFLLDTRISPPWAGLLTEDIRRTLVAQWRDLEPDASASRMLELAETYPLDSDIWMSLARMAAEPGGLPEDYLPALLALATSTAQRRSQTHFEAAQIAMLKADFETTDMHLQSYLAQRPTATADVLALASRWHESADSLVAAVLPMVPSAWENAMRTARRSRDLDLAQSLWESKFFQVTLDDSFFLNYIDTLLRAGQAAAAASIWRMHDPHFPEDGVPNWNFGRPLGSSRGFDWRQQMPNGARLFRDPTVFQTSPASLRIFFDGTENLRLDAPSLQVPVEPESRYLMRGYWRAEDLTTRSLPYLWLRGGLANQRIDVPSARFDWLPWEIHFETGLDTQQVRLSLRRDTSRDFDSDIQGMIWIDSIRIERLGAASAVAADD